MPNNILVIALADINTWTTFKANDSGTIHTPNLDALMARGTTFDNAYCQTALCGPSRLSLLTGQTPKDSGILDHALGVQWYNNLPLSQTLRSLMRDGGYHTAITGKVFHTPSLPPDVRSALADEYSLSTLN